MNRFLCYPFWLSREQRYKAQAVVVSIEGSPQNNIHMLLWASTFSPFEHGSGGHDEESA
jgi:hypothetical protein